MTLRDHYVRAGIAVAGAASAVAVGMTPALALQPTGLPGTFCSNDAGPFTGVGSTLQANAITNVFNPALTAACSKATTLTWGGGGSGKGIASQLDRTSLIGGTDDPLSPATQAQVIAGLDPNNPLPAQASPINTVPVAVSPVSVITNLPCYTSGPLNLSSPMLAKIYDGQINTWDNSNLAPGNPNLATQCAGKSIVRTARADVSGTTFLFKDYLSHRNPEYNLFKQDQLNTTWLGTIGCRGTGTGGEITCVQTTANSIGYAATSNANKATGIQTAKIDAGGVTGAHVFSAPTPAGCTTAAGTLSAALTPQNTLLNWSTATFTDPNGGYGICGFTYDLIFQNTKTAFNGAFSEAQVRDAVDYLTTVLSSTVQNPSPTAAMAVNGYGTLPASVLTIASSGVSKVSYN